MVDAQGTGLANIWLAALLVGIGGPLVVNGPVFASSRMVVDWLRGHADALRARTAPSMR